MTFHISSALASQTASKTAALEILQKLGKRPANLTDNQFLKHHQRTTIEHWWSGVKVVIQPFWESGKHVIEATFHKGRNQHNPLVETLCFEAMGTGW